MKNRFPTNPLEGEWTPERQTDLFVRLARKAGVQVEILPPKEWKKRMRDAYNGHGVPGLIDTPHQRNGIRRNGRARNGHGK